MLENRNYEYESTTGTSTRTDTYATRTRGLLWRGYLGQPTIPDRQ
jgi:hypothetical protein